MIINENINNLSNSSELLIENQVKISKCKCCCFKRQREELNKQNKSNKIDLLSDNTNFNSEKIIKMLDIRNVLKCLLIYYNINHKNECLKTLETIKKYECKEISNELCEESYVKNDYI